MKGSATNYGRIAQIFHWLSMLLIVGLAIGGTIMTRINNTAQQTQMYKMHVTVGLIVLALTVARVLWIFVDKRPDMPEGMKAAQKTAFSLNHLLLYVVIGLLVASGVGMLLLSGVGLSPANVTPEAIKNVTPRTVHDVVSKLFIFLFFMHLAGVIIYQVREGDTFGRMGIPWFSKAS
ncbi:MAG: cytochrome b/b6 domain-containing protein [Ardenticatenaceae bacterium]|nr:cytochrome b/b6 domain-containing protein [Anaerolineales bacterium]MCB8979151.1 cytochrome b/b6 domain-containing protein [Ardenticatenaceae bacterium]